VPHGRAIVFAAAAEHEVSAVAPRATVAGELDVIDVRTVGARDARARRRPEWLRETRELARVLELDRDAVHVREKEPVAAVRDVADDAPDPGTSTATSVASSETRRSRS
jgi:hypothetical protein